VPYFVGHKVSHFFYWPQSAPFIGHKVACFFLLATKGPISFIGHKVANAFALLLPHSLLFGHEVAHAFGVDITCTNTLQNDNMT